MSKRTELIAKYAEDLKSKCKIIPDLSLLEKVTIGCGPAIYSADSETLAELCARAGELDRVVGQLDPDELAAFWQQHRLD